MENKIFTLGQISSLVGGQLQGDPKVLIRGISGIKEAKEGDITFLANPRYEMLVDTSLASAIIASSTMQRAVSKPIIRVENPSLAFAKLISVMFPQEDPVTRGVHPTAIIGKGARLGKNAAIGPYAVIEVGADIGDDVFICAGVFIGRETRIGDKVLIYPNVTIREKTQIGSRVIIHSGTVIGSDGFGFEEVNGVHQKIPQIGIVVVEDDVEIGACVTIDRARFGRTLIGKGTKIDNLVQIAHNVVVGENSIIVAQAGISGSTVLGKKVVLAGQSGLVGHIEIGDNVIVGAQAGVTKSVPENTFVVGSPARPHDISKKIFAGWSKLPELIKEVAALREEVNKLSQKGTESGKPKDNKR